jgi:FkbM family methyltransferase
MGDSRKNALRANSVSPSKQIRKFLKSPLISLLGIPAIRRRVIFEIKYRWYKDLDLMIPLSKGFVCPIPEHDALYSFAEIFASNEYGSFLQHTGLPKRWIDLGCHAGYFTLYLAWQRAQSGENDWTALLIDADARVKEQTEKTIELNQIRKNCELIWGLISSQEGVHNFGLRDGMGSSTDLSIAGIRKVSSVRTLSPSEILKSFPPPYDLIKVDIEGGEYDFVESYEEVYRQASSLLFEWHSSDREGSGEQRLRQAIEARGFRFIETIQPRREYFFDGGWYSSGVQVYRR